MTTCKLKRFLSWDVESCHVALDKELQAIIAQAPEGEEARNGERLIQFASENLVTEVLIQPQLNTLIQCVRNLLSSFTKHRHIIHAGYTFAGNGSWIVQDGTFSLADLIDAFQEPEVQRVLRAYENSVTVDIHCTPEGDWSTARLRRESFSRLSRVRVNPDDCPSPAANIQQFVDYLSPFVRTASIEQLLEPSDVVGNIRFSHPTLYVFPGGQGDAALFGINGFNMLVDGGFARKACFWDFARHLDRLDAVLMTRINNSNINGIASVLRRKKLSHVYPQIGHFFCNLQERKQPSTPEEEKVRDPLLVSLVSEGQEVVQSLRHLQLKPHHCTRDAALDPINLYHKVGHGKLDMYVISPAKDSKELKEFLSKWNSNDVSLFTSASKKPGDKDISFPLQNLVSICALLVWQPANPEDTITRILFPGSTPQHKIFEGLEKLRSLEFMKQPVCTAKTLSPSSSTIGISSKVSKVKSTPAVIDKLLPGEGLTKPAPKSTLQSETKQNLAKTATIPVTGVADTKAKPTPAPVQRPSKPKQEKAKVDNKTDVDKNIEADSEMISKQEKDKPTIISEQIKDKEPVKEKPVKTEKTKSETKPKKLEPKTKVTEKKPIKSSSVEKKDSVKSSPTTPKKSIEAKVNGVATKTEISKSVTRSNKTRISPSATPAKSTKEENNRKVAESKVKSSVSSKPTAGRPPKKEESSSKPKPDKKPIKKPTSASPVKLPSKTLSPVKATKTATKGKKEQKKIKGDTEKGIVTDSSTVSTPSTVDAETAIAKEDKVEVEALVSKDVTEELDQGKVSEKEDFKDNAIKDVDETSEITYKLEEATVIDVADKQEERTVDASEKEFSERDEEDEILIIEKVEIEQYGEDSTVDQESLESHIPDEGEDEIQKHLRDEAESEKKKDDQIITEIIEEKEMSEVVKEGVDQDNIPLEDVQTEKIEEDGKDVATGDLKLSFNKDVEGEKVLTPENREQIEEEVQEIITSATDFVAKAKLEQSKESSELSAEGVGSDEQKTSGETKDLLSSPEKVNLASDKNFTDDDNKPDDTKDKSRELGDGRYAAEESQPDEKFSTTVESGATTAPTLPEDERIPLDEIKEGIEEKYDKEEKEKDNGVVHRAVEQPTTLPQVSVVPGVAFETQASHMLTRDIVKTPDEVADLPVHEEVDGLYEVDDFSKEGLKGKEELLNIAIGKKDVKEEEKNILPELHDVNEIPKGPLELEDDKKLDDEELKALSKIRQELEEEDLKEVDNIATNIDKLPTETGLDDKDVKDKANLASATLHKSAIDIDVKEIVVDKDIVITTLKAQEVAEHVLVTPDSAPDSPLHHADDKKRSKDKIIESQVIESDKPKADTSSTIQREDDAKEDTEKHILDIAQSELESGQKDFKLGTGDQAEYKDVIEEVKATAKEMTETVPASSVLVGPEQISEGIEIVQELNEVDEVETNKTSEIHIKETSSEDVENKHEDAQVLQDTKDIKDVTIGDKIEEMPQGNEKDSVIIKSERNAISNISVPFIEQGLVAGEISTSTERPDTPKALVDSGDTKPHSEDINISDEFTDITKSTGTPSNLKEPMDKAEIPVPSEKSDLKHKEEPTAVLETTHDSPIDVSVVPSEKDEHFVEDQKPSSPKSERPVPDETGDIELSKESLDKILDTKQGTLKSASPVPSDKSETKQEEDEQTVDLLKKRESPKGISPLPSEQEEKVKLDKTPSSPKSASPTPSVTTERKLSKETLDILIDEEQVRPTGTSPDPSEKGDRKLSKDNLDALIDTKPESPKSASPVQSEKSESKHDEEESTAALDKTHDIPKSISPLPSEKEKKVIEDKTTSSPKGSSPVLGESGERKRSKESLDTMLDKKPDSPKSASPDPSEKIEPKHTEDEPKPILGKTQDSPISTSPIHGEKEEKVVEDKKPCSPISTSPIHGEKGEKVVEDKKPSSPKSTSPVPTEKSDRKLSKEVVDTVLDKKRDTPKSSSPVPSEKSDINHEEEEPTVAFDKTHQSPKSSSPVPSEKEENVVEDKKPSSPKSASPTPSITTDRKLSKETFDTVHDSKQDTPKTASPVPSETKHEEGHTVELDKAHEIPKSSSPVPSEKEEKDVEDKKPSSPKSASPTPSITTDGKLSKETLDKVHDEKQDTPKTPSPVPSEKSETKHEEGHKVELDKAHEIPKSISPVPSEKEEKDADDKKPSSPKSASPTPSITTDGKLSKETLDKVHDEKQDTPKTASPVPSEKSETKHEEEHTVDLDKAHEIPKSISPVPSEKEEKVVEDKKPSSPKSASPTPSITTDGKLSKETFDTVHDEKHDTPKSASPVPSEKSETKHEEEHTVDLDKAHEIPKSISPVPSEKEEKVVKDKIAISPKSSTPVPSESDDRKLSKDTLDTLLDKKLESPKSASPVQSEKGESIQDEEDSSAALDKKHEIPKSISPPASEKGEKVIEDKKTSSPKSASPVPGELGESKRSTDILDTLIDKKPDSPKSASPVPSENIEPKHTEDEPQPILGKTQKADPISTSPIHGEKEEKVVEDKKPSSPKSASPVPTEKSGRELSKEVVDTVLDKEQDTPKSTSPLPSDKSDINHEEEEPTVALDKTHQSPKSSSPVPSEKEEKVVEDKKPSSPKSVSPTPSITTDGRLSKETFDKVHDEKQDTPKTASPVPNEKSETKHEEEHTLDLDKAHEIPKSISPVPSEKEEKDVEAKKPSSPKGASPTPSITTDGKFSKETFDKVHDEKQDTPKTASPVPSEKSETKHEEEHTVELDKAHEIQKSISPVPSEKEEKDVEDKKPSSPKSASPTPSITTDGKLSKETFDKVHDEKQDTPKTASPVPSEKSETKHEEEHTVDLDKAHEIPKSISPLPSEKEEKVVKDKISSSPKSATPVPIETGDRKPSMDTVSTPLDKNSESPKSVSPVPSTIDNEKTEKKLDTPTSFSPIPVEDGDVKSTKDDSTLKRDQIETEKSASTISTENIEIKKEYPESLSPVLSADSDLHMSKQTLKEDGEKTVIPTSASPDQIRTDEEAEEKLQHEDMDSAQDIKEDTKKRISSIPKDEVDKEKKQLDDSKHDTPMSVSPLHGGKGDENLSTEALKHINSQQDGEKGVCEDHGVKKETEKKEESKITEDTKHDTPKKDSPAPLEMEDDKTSQVSGTVQVEEDKQKTPKSISPVPSEKESLVTYTKEEAAVLHDSPKSVSPAPTDKGDEHVLADSESFKVIAAKQDTPKSTSPVHELKDGEKKSLLKEDSSVQEESRFSTPNTVSPVPSDGGDLKTKEDKLGTPKSVSPLPGEKDNVSPVPSEKELEAVKSEDSKHETPKSISQVRSEKEIKLPSNETIGLDNSKHDSPKSASQVPSDSGVGIISKEETKGTEKSVLVDNEDRKEMLAKGELKIVNGHKEDVPKTISPPPSDGGSKDVFKKQVEKHDSPKSLSPDLCKKEDELLEQDVGDTAGLKYETETLTEEKIDSQIHLDENVDLEKGSHGTPISLVPEDGLLETESRQLKDKQGTSMGVSEKPTDKSDATILKNVIEQQLDDGKHIPSSISSVHSEVIVVKDVLGLAEDKIDVLKSANAVLEGEIDKEDITDSVKQHSTKSTASTDADHTDEQKVHPPMSAEKEKGASPTSTEMTKCIDVEAESKIEHKEHSSTYQTKTPEQKHTEKGEAMLLDETIDSPKSISPVPSLEKSKGGSSSISASPVPTNLDLVDPIEKDVLTKEKAKLDHPATEYMESSDISPKGSSTIPSEKDIETILASTTDSEPTTTEKADFELSEKHKSKSSVNVSTSLQDNVSKLKTDLTDSYTENQTDKTDPKQSIASQKVSTKDYSDSIQVESMGTGIDVPGRKEIVDKDEDSKRKGEDEKQSLLPVDGMDFTSVISEDQLKDSAKHHELKSEVQEKGILETLESEKDVSKGASKTDVTAVEISDIPPKSISDADKEETFKTYSNDQTIASSINRVTEEKPDTSSKFIEDAQPSDKPEIEKSSLDHTAPIDVNGLSKSVDDIKTDLVTDKTVKSKAVENGITHSDSVVPSKVLSISDKPLAKGSSITDVNVDCKLQSDSRPKETILESTAEIKSASLNDVTESVSDEPKPSVHRMLVTGSSEDGGTETELCSSSVIRMPDDTLDKQLGNISHHAASSSEALAATTGQPSSTTTDESPNSVISEDPASEQTIITTTHYNTDGQGGTNEKDGTTEGDVIKTVTTTVTKKVGGLKTTVVTTTEESVPSQTLQQEGPPDLAKSMKSTSDSAASGVLSQTLKREISDAGRSGTPASDMASEREFEIGGPSTPHSDISSGQASRAATNVWGESSEGRPDSRHCESDDDIPCSPMSVTSHIAQSPPQFDFDVHQHSKEGFYEESSKQKESSIPPAMTSSLYGSLPEEDPLDDYLKSKQQTGESQMYSSMYVSKYDHDEQDDPLKQSSTDGKGQFEAIFKSTKEDIDFETALLEHRSTRGDDLTTKYTNGKADVKSDIKPQLNGKSHSESSTNGYGKQPHLNGKSSQPESLEYQEAPTTSATSAVESSKVVVKSIPSQVPLPEATPTFSSSSSLPSSDEKKDPIEGWGKPLGLPPPPKNLIDSPLSRSNLTLVWNPADEWGIPLGLPSPAPPPVKKDSINGEIDTDITTTSNKTTPKKVARRNAENKPASNTTVGKEASNKSKHPESPVKRVSNKEAKSKPVTPVYMDLTYVPHHGNSHYTNIEFFKRVRARYYVFSGTEPSREVFNALLEAKQTWEDKDLEVTIIPTYDTDTLGYWVAENEDVLAKYKIDLSPSASRCTINLQDHETSCSAYRLEF